METSLSDHSDRITQIEHDMDGPQPNLNWVIQENVVLKAKVEDLESRSKRQNLRVLGLLENVEGKDPGNFMAKMFSTLLDGVLSGPPELDRVIPQIHQEGDCAELGEISQGHFLQRKPNLYIRGYCHGSEVKKHNIQQDQRTSLQTRSEIRHTVSSLPPRHLRKQRTFLQLS